MPALARCTAQRHGGAFCDAGTIEGSPFPICFHHAMQVHRYFTDALRDAAPAPQQPTSGELATGDVVYYVEWAKGRVKIGHSSCLHRRMKTLAVHPDQVLAVEPGKLRVERARHRQFKSDRVSPTLELFHVSGELAEHIRQVRAEHPDLIVRMLGAET